jgi:hypothetical protein
MGYCLSSILYSTDLTRFCHTLLDTARHQAPAPAPAPAHTPRPPVHLAPAPLLLPRTAHVTLKKHVQV